MRGLGLFLVLDGDTLRSERIRLWTVNTGLGLGLARARLEGPFSSKEKQTGAPEDFSPLGGIARRFLGLRGALPLRSLRIPGMILVFI